MEQVDGIREVLSERYDEPLLFLTEEMYDSCIIGVVSLPTGSTVVAYDADKCIHAIYLDIKSTREEDGEDEDPDYDDYTSALDHFTFNVSGSYIGDETPIFIERCNDAGESIS